MESIVTEIDRALKTLQLPADAMRLLDDVSGDEVYQSALAHFVSTGDRRWWWEAFRERSVSVVFKAGDGWSKIPDIAPKQDEQVWFIAEDDKLPQFPVFETSAAIASRVLGECYGFEYYLVAKDFSWLLCETHHNVVIAVGSPVEQRLLAYAT
jgi:hypothetical protein